MNIAQRSFSGGELSPSLHARVDQVKYQTGARTMRNTSTRPDGGSQSRPGTEFIGEARQMSKTGRLVPFVYDDDNAYVIEFSDQYYRIYKDQAILTYEHSDGSADTAISGVTQASECTISVGNIDSNSGISYPEWYGIIDGSEVYISGVVGMTELNGNIYVVSDVDYGANTFKIKDTSGNYIDSSAFTSYSSGGNVSIVHSYPTEYLEADIMDLQFASTGGYLIITHPDYIPKKIVFSPADEDDNPNIITDLYPFTSNGVTNAYPVWGPKMSVQFPYGPTSLTIGTHPTGSRTERYIITAIDDASGDESLPGVTGSTSISAIATTTTSVTFTAAGLGGAVGDLVYVELFGTDVSLVHSRYFTLSAVSGDDYTISNLDGTEISGFSSGTISLAFAEDTSVGTLSASNPMELSWMAKSGAREYNVYKELNGVYGFIGVSTSTAFDDTGIDPDVTNGPPVDRISFRSSTRYPKAITYIQQRLGFGGYDSDEERVSLSKTGSLFNFTNRTLSQDDDAFEFSLAGRQKQNIKFLSDIGALTIFTNRGVWVAEGGSNNVITPSQINLRQYSRKGISDLPPIELDSSALYIQAKSNIIRDLKFEFQIDGYKGNDITNFSKHLFDNYTIRDWCYQDTPGSIVWVARSDGTLLGCTYVLDQNILSWHRHDFQGGDVENVCSVSEGDQDYVYMIVERTINSGTKRYIERMAKRDIDDIKDFKGMDSSLTYDGTNTAATTMTLSGGTDWLNTETLTLTASASTFASTNVGDQVHLYILDSDGVLTDTVRFTINAYSSATVVTGKANKTVPAALRSTATDDWGLAVDSITGLDHLEGEEVSVLADGFVDGSPYNPAYTTYTVSGGAITLSNPRVKVHVGLPFIADLETLDVDTVGGEPITDKGKLSSKLTVWLDKTRGGFVGPKPPSNDSSDALENLIEFKPRTIEDYDSPPTLKTGKYELDILGEWNTNGRIFIRQVDPLPMSVLAVVQDGDYPIRRSNADS